MAVGGGAAAGAWLRWLLGMMLNPVFPTLPLGTLAANLLGGWLMGLALGFLGHYESLPPEMRLFITTGFLGGLTTFSTFSAEKVEKVVSAPRKPVMQARRHSGGRLEACPPKKVTASPTR